MSGLAYDSPISRLNFYPIYRLIQSIKMLLAGNFAYFCFLFLFFNRAIYELINKKLIICIYYIIILKKNQTIFLHFALAVARRAATKRSLVA